MEKEKSVLSTILAIIGIFALAAAGAYFALKFLKKKKCCCDGEGENEIEDCDETVCIIDEDSEDETI